MYMELTRHGKMSLLCLEVQIAKFLYQSSSVPLLSFTSSVKFYSHATKNFPSGVDKHSASLSKTTIYRS